MPELFLCLFLEQLEAMFNSGIKACLFFDLD